MSTRSDSKAKKSAKPRVNVASVLYRFFINLQANGMKNRVKQPINDHENKYAPHQGQREAERRRKRLEKLNKVV